MKFDAVVGNPPYQVASKGDNKNFALPVYHLFMKAAFKLADKVSLIHPARCLFNAGATPKDFNQQLLNDEHFKVVKYFPNAKELFPSIDLVGGVVISYRDANEKFGAIRIFIPFEELASIHKKVVLDNENFLPLSEIIYPRAAYRFVKDNSPISTNAFEKISELFFDVQPKDGKEYIKIYGRQNNERVYKWIRREDLMSHDSLNKYKVFVPKANGASGMLGEDAARIISQPIIGEPFVGSTDTFITIGAFDTREEAHACLKYVKSKFARAMLGILKITQDNTADKWAMVPLQDFKSESDIDWSHDVDAQLYKKYGLDDSEIKFIESHVKEMT